MIIDKHHPAAPYIIVKNAKTGKAVALVTKIDTDKGELERLEFPEADAPMVVEKLSEFDLYVNFRGIKYMKDYESFEEGTPA